MARFPLVTVLLVGYRRPMHLTRTVQSLLTVTKYPNLELLLTDDGSPPEMLEVMRKLPFDRILTSPRNEGLGANTNKGLAAARGDYILQLQDDWECRGPSDFIEAAIEVASSDNDLQFIRLTNRDPSLAYEVLAVGARRVRVYRSPPSSRKDFIYTDTPHLKTRSLTERLGRYRESRYMQKTELDMRNRFNRRGYGAAFIEGYSVFDHIGDDASFNSLLPLARVGKAMDGVPGLRQAAWAYRRLKGFLGK